VEYREVQFGPRGQTGRILAIDPAREATVQKIPLEFGVQPVRLHLSCEEMGELLIVMKDGFIAFRRDISPVPIRP
jgi:hypothetical protein